MNAPNPAPTSDAAPAVCASYLEALYPAVRTKGAIAVAVSVDAALGDIPRRWQAESLDDRGCYSVPLLADKVVVGHLIECIKATYREGIARDARPRHIAFALHNVSGLAWIDYACVLDQPNTQTAAVATVVEAPAEREEQTVKASCPAPVAAAGSHSLGAVSTPPNKGQTPTEIVASHPHLSAAQAAKMLLIESALGDVPHYWTEKVPDGRAFSAIEPEGATEAALVERVRLISTTYANKTIRLALAFTENMQRLTIVVPRPPSSPKKQTIDDLLDLYPMLTAREAVCLASVVDGLALTPTEWVTENSGHTYDNNGVFVDAEKMLARVHVAYNEVKVKNPNSHVVLSLRRIVDGSNVLFYYFIVLPVA